MEELCLTMKDASLCGLGQSAANPVLSTLKYFKQEYDQKLVKPGNNGKTHSAAPQPAEVAK